MLKRREIASQRARFSTGIRPRGAGSEPPQGVAEPDAHAALEHLPDPVLITDAHGSIRFVNRAFRRLTGDDDAVALSSHVDSYLSQLDGSEFFLGTANHDGAFQALLRLSPTGVPIEGQVGRLPDDGGLCITLRSGAERPGEAAALSATLDATERLHAELGHDLNNQLSAVLNYSFVLARQSSDVGQHAALLRELQASAWRAASLGSHLSSLGRREAPEPTRVQLPEVMRGLSPLLTRMLDESVVLTIEKSACNQAVLARRSVVEELLIAAVLELRPLLWAGGHLRLDALSGRRNHEEARARVNVIRLLVGAEGNVPRATAARRRKARGPSRLEQLTERAGAGLQRLELGAEAGEVLIDLPAAP